MIKNTILVVGAAYVGTMMPAVAGVMAMLAALSVGVLAFALDRSSQANAS